MKKLIIASVSGLALMGLAACSDTDDTTTQGLPADDPAATTTQDPAAVPPPANDMPAEEPAPVE